MNKSKLNMYFDLENTLINHWTDVTLCHEKIIEEIINNCKDNFDIEFGIYSYALWCEDNINEFIENIQPIIEKRYNIKINKDMIINVNDMCKDSLIAHPTMGECSLNEQWKYFRKTHAFIDFAKTHENVNYMLVDDTVENDSVWAYNDTLVRFKNPLA